MLDLADHVIRVRKNLSLFPDMKGDTRRYCTCLLERSQVCERFS